jgi:hypothetical protein
MLNYKSILHFTSLDWNMEELRVYWVTSGWRSGYYPGRPLRSKIDNSETRVIGN